ncbi:MAG: choice-of-anchor U domain-containing protein [Halioglobus sp.]|nr:choice-of-anchor U domain-containing protein [Halioglobus sp.]
MPDAPIIGTAAAGNAQAQVAFTAPADNGGASITGYTATSSPSGLVGTCASSPCTVAGLTNGTEYTFTVVATNSAGDSAPSAASNAVTPDADTDGDGTGDSGDAFPDDPVEDADTDGDGIGDNGDAGGTGVGVRISNAPATCQFVGGVQANSTQFTDSAPGNAFGTQLSFVLSGCGNSVTIEALFGEALPAGSRAYKVSAGGEWIEIPGAVINGSRITYTVTDNGPLDDDDVPGVITDPVTVVQPGNLSPNSIPTLPWTLLALLSGLVGWLGWRRLAT